MAESNRRTRLLPWVAAAVAVAHVAALRGVVPVDDDYIVYRYARNLLEHGEYAFNVGGPASDGVTSPGWLLVALLGLGLGAAPELWTPLVGAASFACLAWLVTRTLQRAAGGTPWVAAPGGLAVALSSALAWHARAGLGTLPVALCLAIALDRGHLAQTAEGARAARARRALGWALGAAVLLRPEALLAAGTTLVAPRLRSRAVLLPTVALAALVAGARWVAFGRLAPAAAGLKALPITEELAYGFDYLTRSAAEGGLGILVLLGGIALLRPAPLRWVGATSALAFLGAVAVGGDWMVYGRFWIPCVSFGVVGVLASTGSLGRVVAFPVLALSLVGFGALAQARFENRFFERHWLRVGDGLAERAPEGASIALSPVGAIGWRSGLEVIDVLGLTHDAFHDLPPDTEGVAVKGHHRHDGAWVLDQAPDYLLLGNARFQPDTGRVDINPWEADIVSDPRFGRDYVTGSFPLESGERVPYARRRGAPRL